MKQLILILLLTSLIVLGGCGEKKKIQCRIDLKQEYEEKREGWINVPEGDWFELYIYDERICEHMEEYTLNGWMKGCNPVSFLVKKDYDVYKCD